MVDIDDATTTNGALHAPSLGNVTFLPSTINYDHTKQLDWIIPVAVNLMLMVITLWLLLSLIHYGIKTRKWSRSGQSDKLNAGLIYTSVLVCAGTCMVRYGASLVYMNIGFDRGSSELCDAVADAAVCLYALVLFSVYLFLWFRQRVFYTTYVVRSSFSDVFSFFSSGSIGMIFVAGVCAAVLNVLPNNHRSSTYGCIYTPDEAQRIGYWISVAVAVFLGQAVLLALFIYPLQRIFNLCPPFPTLSQTTNSRKVIFRRSRKITQQQQASIRPVITSVTEQSQSTDNNQSFAMKLSPSFRRATTSRVSQILRRTFIFAVVSLSSDIFLLVFSNYIVKARGNRRVPSMIYDINSFLNLLLVVLSFVQYKEMVTSTSCKRKANASLFPA